MNACLFLGLSVLLLAGSFLVIAIHFYNLSLRPKGKKARDPRTLPTPDGTVRQQLSEGRRWLLERSGCGHVFLPSPDGLMLHAYYQEQQSHRWAVCVHGYWDSASGMGYWARHYAELGWNYLLPDLRGHGRSEGGYVGMGWPDRLDILMWLRWIQLRDPGAEVVLHGVSMGASAVLMATGERTLPPSVRAAVSDCAFSCTYDQFRHITENKMKLRLPFPLIMAILRVAAKIRAGYDLLDASAEKQVRSSATPTLFIHGSGDLFVPAHMLDTIYNAAACPKARLLIPGAGHTAAAPTDPELYWETVDSFLARYFNGGIRS